MRISDWSSDVCSSDLLSRPMEQVDVAVGVAARCAETLCDHAPKIRILAFPGRTLRHVLEVLHGQPPSPQERREPAKLVEFRLRDPGAQGGELALEIGRRGDLYRDV